METITFNEFCDKVNQSFDALLAIAEIHKSGNIELLNVLKEVK